MSEMIPQTHALPFHNRADFFPATSGEEAIARILFLAEQQWPAGWLLGPAGCGKTTAFATAGRRLRAGGVEAVHLGLGSLLAEEFWIEVAFALGSRDRQSGLAAKKTIRGLLAASSMINRPVVMLLDDADRGLEPFWDEIATLVRIAEGTSPRHSIVMATGGSAPSGDLSRRIDLRAELRPFTREETGRYLETGLAACDDPIPFGEEGAGEIFAQTGGVPGMINRLADLALVTARGSEVDRIDAEIVRSAAGQLHPPEEEPLVRFTVNPPAARASA